MARKQKKTAARENSSRGVTETDRQVGETVRALRHEAAMTLAEFSAELGISHQQLQKYETGANRLSVGMAAKVATVLGVRIETLFEGAAGVPGAAVVGLKRRQLTAARDALNVLLGDDLPA